MKDSRLYLLLFVIHINSFLLGSYVTLIAPSEKPPSNPVLHLSILTILGLANVYLLLRHWWNKKDEDAKTI